jgi:hypothetical protein
MPPDGAGVDDGRQPRSGYVYFDVGTRSVVIFAAGIAAFGVWLLRGSH